MSQWSQTDAFELVSGTSNLYRTTTKICYDIGKKNSGLVLTIQKGTEFDISVPWILEWFLSPHDMRFLPAALPHDHLLKHGFDPIFASAEMHRAAVARKYPVWKSWIIFVATLIVTSIKRAMN